ncbi:hypothetical protein BV25DRAFT_1921471 [Artomyces pyxidatus]|uniref:Uncharacterized protein n=1 Tax=Artomyces pyxidatus TaxID=48021 RepID=A0ACB8SHW5_9AGAM|nr:hypothetical protein BV25DRAFT_1921471 [Artomyces pyxidatus]
MQGALHFTSIFCGGVLKDAATLAEHETRVHFLERITASTPQVSEAMDASTIRSAERVAPDSAPQHPPRSLASGGETSRKRRGIGRRIKDLARAIHINEEDVLATATAKYGVGGLGMVGCGAGGVDAVEVRAGIPWELSARSLDQRLNNSEGCGTWSYTILKVTGILTVKGGAGAIVECKGPDVESPSATNNP